MKKIISKNVFTVVNLFLSFVLIAGVAILLTGCYFHQGNIFGKKGERYISITTTPYYVEEGMSKISIYDSSMKEISSKTINNGGYNSYIEKENNIYFFGGKCLLRLDKKTGEIEDFGNVVEHGNIDLVNAQGDSLLFINNIRALSKTEYDSAVCEISDLDNPEVVSFKTDKTLAMDAIKINNKYFVLSANFDNSKSKYVFEVYDDNHELISTEPLGFGYSFYEFYKKGDDIYIIGVNHGGENGLIKFNKDETLTKVDIDDFSGQPQIDQLQQKLYILNNDGAQEFNIEENKITPVVDIKKADEEYRTDNDYTLMLYFTENSKAARAVIRNKDNANSLADVKVFNDENKNLEFKEIENVDFEEDGLMLRYFGKLQ